MGVVQFDIQKIEQLLNSATSEKQRKMYQALLDKARKQERSSTDFKASGTTSEIEKKAQTQTTKAKKKATRPGATTSASPARPQSITPVPKSTTQGQEEESDLPPQTELESQSPKPDGQEQPDTETRIFQALGAIVATPYLKDDRLKVAIDEGEYDLLPIPDFRRRAHILLKAKLEKNGSSPMFLRLYPQAKFEPNSQQPKLSFSLVNFSSNCEKIKDEPQGFMLRGIWQYIPSSKSPVISIYRNRAQWEYFKKLKGKRQFYFAKPYHIPVVWDAPPVEPFKFNPQAQKDSQMPRYFVEVRAIFKDGLYVVEEMLGEPTVEIPKFIKVPKKK